MTEARDTADLAPAAQLLSCIERLDPAIQKRIRAVGAALRERFPTANELAYDYSTSVVIGYSPSDKGIEAIVAVAARPTGVFLYFNQGQQLPDPEGILLGKGKQTRYIELESAQQLEDPYVDALITATVAQAKIPFAAEGEGRLIIKSEASKKRARKTAAK